MNGRISARQLMLIIASMRVSAILVLLPVVQFGGAHQDAWIASIVSTATSCAVATLPAYLAMKFPGRSFGRYAKDVLGPFLGFVAVGFVGLSSYILAMARTRAISLVVISQFMPKTPGWGIAVPLFAAGVYGAILGPDSMGRFAEIIFTFLAGSLVLGTALWYGSKAGPIVSLRPVLSQGLGPVLTASISPTFLGATASSVALALGAFVKKASGVPRAVSYGIIIANIFLLAIVLQVLTTIGHEQAESSLAPLLALTSSINVKGVLERMDLLLLASWIMGTTFDVTMLLMSTAIIIGDALSVSFRIVATVLFLVGIVPISHRITDVFIMRQLHSIPVAGTWTLAYLGVVGSVLIAALVKERRKRRS